MGKNLVLSPESIRARVQAMSAMHILMNELDKRPLTDDNAAVINQCIVSGFSMALMHIAPWVENFTVEPTDFYNNPSATLRLEVVLKSNASIQVEGLTLVRCIEEYIAYRVMAEVLPSLSLQKIYEAMAVDAITQLKEILSLPGANCTYRIKRTI